MYHYTECGLNNVWLKNGYTSKKTAYGEAVAIADVDGLHKVIALGLLEKGGRITGKELRFLRLALNLSQASLAKLVGASEQSLSLWERTGKVPQHADTITRLLISDTLNGTSKVRHIVDRINDVERLCNQKIVATERHHKWSSKTEVQREELEPA